jgi:hypothetical protein
VHIASYCLPCHGAAFPPLSILICGTFCWLSISRACCCNCTFGFYHVEEFALQFALFKCQSYCDKGAHVQQRQEQRRGMQKLINFWEEHTAAHALKQGRLFLEELSSEHLKGSKSEPISSVCVSVNCSCSAQGQAVNVNASGRASVLVVFSLQQEVSHMIGMVLT